MSNTICSPNHSPKPLFNQKAPTKAVLALRIPSVFERATETFHRYYSKGAKTANGCTIWSGFINWDGYGLIHVALNKKEQEIMFKEHGINAKQITLSAHRFSFMLYNGVIASGGSASHICNNRACVEQTHLKMGSHKDNIIEKVKARRHNRKNIGSNGKRFDPEFLAQSILPIYLGLASRYEVSQKTGISRPYLSVILNGHAAPHVMKRVVELAQWVVGRSTQTIHGSLTK